MNGRIKGEPTPAGRIAAAVMTHARNVWNKRKGTGFGPETCDFADVEKAIEPFIKVELLRCEVKGARRFVGSALSEAMRALEREIEEAEKALPDVYKL